MQNMDTTDPEMVALANQPKPIHLEVNKSVGQIKTLVANNQLAEVKELLEKKFYPSPCSPFTFYTKWLVSTTRPARGCGS